ncbi:peptidoglycan-binding protein LysM [Streptomyces sp. NPDC086519]|uniref:peptidoglycan-binding protein LysM n=1 Tax=Streptomyces sp. NPDC086519 TaxID=3154863 RepID=UPI003428AF1F
MTTYHAAILHPDQTITYCGQVDQDHVDTVRALAAIEDVPRFVKEHPRTPGAFFVLREDGDLDCYQPVDTETFERRIADPGGAGTADVQALTATGTTWIPGAIRIGDGSIGGAMDHPENPPRVVEHTTESPAGGSYLESVGSYLVRVASEPQLIYCPVTDRIGQFGPLNQSARALKNDGTRRTNREGRVCIQWEVLGYAAHPWTTGWDPAKKPGYQKLLAAADSWGVPRVWPAGAPPAYPGGSHSRSRTVWQGDGGYFAHADVPGNDHGDPGAIDVAKVPGKVTVPPKPPVQTKPKVSLAHVVYAAKHDPQAAQGHTTYKAEVLLVEKALDAEGYLSPGYVDGSFGTKTVRAYQLWQQHLGYSGSAADGIPGMTSLTKLGAKHGFSVVA